MVRQGAPSQRKIPSPFWRPLSVFVVFFACRMKEFLASYIFVDISFGSLGRSMEGLICNLYVPVRSKRTCRFSVFLRTYLKKRHIRAPFLPPFPLNISMLCDRKVRSNMWNKMPARVKMVMYRPFPSPADSLPRVRISQPRGNCSRTNSNKLLLEFALCARKCLLSWFPLPIFRK